MIELFIFVLICIIAGAAGAGMVPGRGTRRERGIFDAAIVLPAGFALISYAVYLLGSASLLYPSGIIALLAVLLLLFHRTFLFIKGPFPGWHVFDRGEKVLFFLAAFFPLVALSGALAPAIGTDSLCYHLGIPKKFVLQHRIGFIPYTMNSLYPFFMEMLFTLGIVLKNAVLAKLFHWGMGVLLASCVYFFTREVSDRKTGLLAALLVMSSPGIFNEMVYAYVDVGLSLYAALSVFLLILWMQKGRGSLRYLVFSGLFLGVCFSIKYLAFYAAVPMAAVLIWHLVREQGKTGMARPLAAFFLPCAAVSFFWYLKSYIVLGDPVFPVLSGFLRTPVAFDVGHHFDMGMGKGIVDLLRLPWDLAVHPSRFGGRGSQVGIQYFALLPFLVFGFFSGKSWFRRLAFIAAGYVAIWFFLVQRDRFLYPVLPVFAVLISYSVHVLFSGERKRQRVFSFLAVLLLTGAFIFNAGICVYHNRHNYRVTLGLETRDAYLKRWVTNYRMAKFVNTHLPEDAKILGTGIYKVYYFDRWIVREGLFEMWEGYREKYKTAEDMREYLKSNGFTHVIYKKINDEPVPGHVKLIVDKKEPLFTSGPVQNPEKPQKEQFFLYEI
ncbi:MAG: glycosyltransferase family 39 protein [Candidatus Omnitrophica bacterium]|nr:glycosyltransferase family 39 protein [Candidatus Omnitrophota bacterium]